MKNYKYIIPALLVGFSLFSCEDDEPAHNSELRYKMLNRTCSIEQGSVFRYNTVGNVVLQYNNLVGLNDSFKATLNGQPVNVYINPDNGMELIVDIVLDKNVDYTLELPQGLIYRRDDSSVLADAKTINFSTKIGIDKNLVATSLSNANASAEAKAVYQFLLDNYGTRQLSGAMGAVGWGLEFTNFISEQTGQYPAIVGFDYLHLASSPSNWIDYGDITPVQTIWNAGSIPAFTWHWNVPGAETLPVDTLWEKEPVVMPGDWSGNIQIPASVDTEEKDEDGNVIKKELFADTKVGQFIMVQIKDVKEGAQGSLKNSSWSEIAKGSEYFDISGDSYTWKIDQDVLEQLKEGGLIISGHDYTVTGVYIAEGDPELKSDAGRKFSPAKMLQEGTWENEIYKADVAKLAGYMTLLRDAGIPLIWRPFHEAAGDYKNDKDTGEKDEDGNPIYKPVYGAWFWWGQDGPEVTKQLYIKLYNDLTGTYGLNNLIWVWTVQTTKEYQLAPVEVTKASYPGDNYVDILGADLYEDPVYSISDENKRRAATLATTAKFDLVNATADRKKIVALSETGNLLDVDAAYGDEALWSYFMSWYDKTDDDEFIPAFNQWNTTEIWNEVMKNPLVINQGGVNLK